LLTFYKLIHPINKRRDLILVQHQYNNPSHEGGSHILGPTLM
jgi:hypothetical protein